LRERGSASAAELDAAGISPAVLRELARKGLAEKFLHAEQPAPRQPAAPGLTLNPQQAAALGAIAGAAAGFSCHLLEGVTGSGKTEIYLQLIAGCLQAGRQALVLVPEIGLTPQTLDRFRARFGERVAILHSGLSEGARHAAWEASRDGRTDILLGTRSAIFTPLARPGIIIVDEEHDSSYKQQDGFRYSARDVAVKRGQLEEIPVVLGSATPSLETLYNALRGRYGHARITARAGSARLPAIRALDVRRQPLECGFSAALLAAIGASLDAGHQVLLFLNRRGYAASLRCHDCGWIAGCEHCDARLTVHRRANALRCHHCGSRYRLPPCCPACGSSALLAAGLGTEQVEEFLQQRYTTTPVFRVDSDTVQGRDGMARLVGKVNTDRPCILVGTQMLTKGHHFPGVALVAVLDTDAALFSADFRGEERMAQLLTQVAGRAERGDTPGQVLLQTHYPDHPAVQSMLGETYHEQARKLLAGRTEAGLPPAGHLILFHAEASRDALAEEFLQALREAAAAGVPPGTRVIGPLPAPMQRRAGWIRSQLVILARSRQAAHRCGQLLVAEAGRRNVPRGLRWFIDVDPLEGF
jgi:primosomal protein N' (replication factor Y)